MPGKPQIERKLAAIMFTDIAGYTALSAKDETKALNLLDTQKQILTPIIEEFNGTLHKEMGDGLLFTFPTVTEAVKCGIKIQEETKAIDDLNLRVGIHEGEITLKDGDALGDDVNVASRIEAFAPSGGIAISSKVQQNISSLPEFETSYVGKPELKGVAQKVEVYCITSHGLPKTDISKVTAKLEDKPRFNIYTLTGGILTAIGVAFWIAVGVFEFSFGGKDEVPSVGILMMDNLGKEDEEFWSSGMTADLITKVAGAGLIRVAPLKDIRNIDSNLSIEEIAKKLRVKYILTHSFLIKDDGFDLWCKLENIETGVALFSNKISEPMSMTTQMVGKLANDIITSLEVNTKQDVMKTPTANVEAYEYYLKAKYKYFKRENKEDTEIFKGLLEQAIELDDNLIVAKNLLGKYYTDMHNYKKAIEIYQKNLLQAEKLDDKSELASALISISNSEDDSLQLEYIQRALMIYEVLNDRIGIARAFHKFGSYYSDREEYETSLDYYNRSLIISQELGDKRGIGWIYNDIGIIYGKMGDIHKMLDYWERQLAIFQKIEYQHGIAWTFWNTGFRYVWDFYDYDKGLDYINKSVAINLALGSTLDAESGKMSGVYLAMGDYDTALQYSNVGLQFFEEQEWDGGVAWMLTTISIINIEKRQFDKAVTNLERALLIVSDWENANKILPIAVLLALSKKNLGKEYDIDEINKLIKDVDQMEVSNNYSNSFIYTYGDKIGFDTNYYNYQLLEDTSYLETAYNQVQEKADKLEPDIAAKFLSYPIPKAIVEEWEKVK